jgi:2',3'-cyclic-nucleotide 2'-phosphodiesterase (5'-nucleotidase family)
MQKKSSIRKVMAVTFALFMIAILMSALLQVITGTDRAEISTPYIPNTEINDDSGSEYSGTIRILTTPDIHSHLFLMSDNDTGSRIGRISALADTLGEENPDTLYLFAGDLGEGNFYHMYSGIPEAEAYSMAGIDAAVLGNHAFDYSTEVLKDWAENSSYPIICANLDFSDSELNNTVKDYIITDAGSAKVGVFGIITPELKKIAANMDDVILYENTSAIAESMVKELENKGCDVIIALTHQYADEDIKLAESVSGIDLIIGGHDHLVWNETVTSPDGKKTLIVHAGKYGEELDRVALTLENSTVTNSSLERYEITEDMPDDESITSFVMPYYENYTESLSGPIGYSSVPLDATYKALRTGESNAGNFITDTIRQNVPDSEIAFINSGTIRGDCIIPAGEISYLTLNTMLPFENMIVNVLMTGDEIKDTLERSASALIIEGDDYSSEERTPTGGFLQVSGVRFEINTKGEPFRYDSDTDEIISRGNRIETISVVTKDGIIPIEPDKT